MKIRIYTSKSLLGALLLGLLTFSAFGQVSVLGGHNDIGRTGANTQETTLTPASVASGNFERLLSIPLNGVTAEVAGQPLYVPGVRIGGVTHNVLIAATSGDDVFAVDADNGVVLWQITLLDAAHGAGPDAINDPQLQTGCAVNQNSIKIGITGTPTIDSSTGTIYLVGRTWENNRTVQRIHALDITSGNEKFDAPTTIQATVPGTGWSSVSGQLSFDPQSTINRAGLLLLHGVVYVSFAAACEGYYGGWHGWVIGYDAAKMTQTGAWVTTPNATGSGIWMSGAALAADVIDPVSQPFGRMFVATGNGTFDAIPPYTAHADFGDDIVRLDLTNGAITPQDSFTVDNQASLNSSDGDLGSGSVLVLPDSVGSLLHPHLLVQSGKAGNIFLVDRDEMGGYNSKINGIVQEVDGALSGGLFAASAYWNGNLYFWGATGPLEAFSIANGVMSSAPTSVSPTAPVSPGATPSISANGETDGIVWALTGKEGTTQTLQAFDAMNVATVLYSSQTDLTRDNPGKRTKWSVPTVANGKVYAGSIVSSGSESLSVFGSMFAVIAQSAIVQAGPGSSPTAALAISSPFGSSFSGEVALSVTGLPEGVTANFSSPSVTLGQAPASGPSVMTLHIPNSIAVGNYRFNVIGESGNLLSSVAFTLIVPVSVPNVVGDTQAVATKAITDAGLVLGTVTSQFSGTIASGNVIGESPVAGTSVSAGTAVNLVVSSGANGTPTVVSVTPNPATGLFDTFALKYSDTAGYASLNTVAAVFNSGMGTTASCYVLYSQASNLLYLYNDGGSGTSSITPGSGMLSNSQCSISGSGTSVVVSGNTLTLNLAVTAAPTYAGIHSIFMKANDNDAATSGWVNIGTWTPATNQPPTVISVTPTPPVSGLSNTFVLTYADPNGAQDLNLVGVVFNSGIGTSHSCYVLYSPTSNLLYLDNDAGTEATEITPGSGTLSNSQCTISGGGTSVVRSGNTLTLNLAVAVTSTYTGPHSIFMKANDDGAATSGWVNRGTWAPATNQPPAVLSLTPPPPVSGLSDTFALTYSDPNGAQDLNLVGATFNSGTSTSTSCYVLYSPVSNLLYLYNDGGTGTTKITPGSGTLSNGQCRISGSGTSVVISGNTLTLNLAVTVTSTYTGIHGIFMKANDNSAASSGWVNIGTWTPNQPPAVISVTPTPPVSGLTNTFVLAYSDPNGAQDLDLVGVTFNSGIGTSNSCYVLYSPASNLLYLDNNAGTGATEITPGSGTLSNSQCTISGSGTSVVRSGNTLTLNLAVTAAPTYTGTHSIFMKANDNSAASSGWVNIGTWTP